MRTSPKRYLYIWKNQGNSPSFEQNLSRTRVKHWHGAASDSWFAHLAFEITGEETGNEWLSPVTDEEYNKLK